MQRLIAAAMTVTCILLTGQPAFAGQPAKDAHFQRHSEGYPGPKEEKRPQIDVAFLLDTTGSMVDLIHGAKIKIWSIAKEMLDAEVAPDLRMALIGYRDRGDAYVTRTYDLTDDIDRIYGELLKFEAEGGGDRPESVNQALDDAVNGLSWDRGDSVYRVVFLVGDAPPKMSYRDDVKYPVTARLAAEKDIVINTVLAGGASDTGKIWREIAHLSQGRFAAIPQSGNMQVIETPFDQDIQTLNLRLNGTALLYGRQAQQEEAQQKLDRTALAPRSVIADKSAYLKSKGSSEEIITGRGELINDLAEGRVTLDELTPETLPEDLKALSPDERAAAIADQVRLRESLRHEIDGLVGKRDLYIKQELIKRGDSDSFDGEVGAIIREQGAAKGILY
jgi:hypothetical protein